MNQWPSALGRYAQTTAREAGRLIAVLATHDGSRRRVGWLLDVAFVSMVDELEARGVPRRVASDMLGLSHRTLQRRYAAALASSQQHGRSAWTNVVEVLRGSPMTRAEVASRAGTIPPVVVASVLNDMSASGWVEERDERLHLTVEMGDALSPEALREYVDVRLRVEPGCGPAEVAQELGVDEERVRKVWSRSEPLLVHSQGESTWMVMESCLVAANALLRATALDSASPRHSASFWRVRLDDKPEEFRGILRRQLSQFNRRLAELVEPVATQADDEEGAEFWTFAGFQSSDWVPEEEV